LALFRRRRPLHAVLAEQGGLGGALEGGTTAQGLAADTPGWDGVQRGEAGIHGVPRARRWDAVVTATAPGLTGDALHFAAVGGGELVGAEGEPPRELRGLADAVEQVLATPYRAEAVRRDEATWAVAARRIQVVAQPGLTGDEAELVVRPDGSVLRVDGETTLRNAPALAAFGAALGPERIVRAWRIVGDLWEVEATAL
jgi:hypothetical protein